ncbi:ATPase inhibitor mai-2, mitochondrial-like [Chironomus tepperi]|uniref:ATPase inhibitor mai-2, mitochondrial-like n=1 Tax=Chironomus tepperi TaxID=113505 RepID=UPI00391EEB3A
MNSLRRTIQIAPRLTSSVRMMGIGPGDHDTSGSIRSAGGSFAKMEIAHEEEYFYKLRKDQLHKLKEQKMHELEFREKAIKDHEDAINRHKVAIDELRKQGH